MPLATPPPIVSLREISACTRAQGGGGNFALQITYQLVVNGTAITGGAYEMASLVRRTGEHIQVNVRAPAANGWG